MSLAECKIEVAPEQIELIENLLLELGESGWSLLEDAIARRAWLVGIFADSVTARNQWEALLPLLPEAPRSELEIRELADRDWRDSYKAHFKAWKFGRLHWVPIWEREQFTLPAGDALIWLDPGLAFGTGNHETTRLCVERLVALTEGVAGNGRSLADLRVIDAGCGSGILALSAAKLQFGRVEGFDNDAEAVRVSQENAELNGLTGQIDFFVGDLISGLRGRSADVVLSNIQADVLMRFARELIEAVAPGGTLVLSGILARERDQVRACFSALAPNWATDSRVLGEWSDVVLTRPS